MESADACQYLTDCGGHQVIDLRKTKNLAEVFVWGERAGRFRA